MFIFLTILFSIVTYLILAGATHGYAKHRWPKHMVKRRDEYGTQYDSDENEGNRLGATILWPFYWVFVWPFTKVNEVTFSNIEKRAGHKVTLNKARIAELRATREQLEASNEELEAAEADLDKEIARGL